MKDLFYRYSSDENADVNDLYEQYLTDFKDKDITFKEYLIARQVVVLDRFYSLYKETNEYFN
ncbi:MAG: hypothetical protein KH501_05530 [Eubacterium limosum]|nr:hypothetical protein [Eubacterium limosum]